MTIEDPLLMVDDLTVEYPTGSRHTPFRAVDSVSFSIGAGETLGLVGESGSGKSSIAKAILHLAPITSGSLKWRGEDITNVTPRSRRNLSAQIQVVFQDPYSSFNPSRTIESSLVEMLIPQPGFSRTTAVQRATELLDMVGMPTNALTKLPGEFSGGQRQRIAIARALMVNPSLLICDEAVSALDLSVQAQVINLIQSIQHEFGLAVLFISHDLTVVDHVSQRVMVLYRGRTMETGNAHEVNTQSAHPYTRLLMEAIPIPDPELSAQRRSRAKPAILTTRSDRACIFAPRCSSATEICETVAPQPVTVRKGHVAVCHHSLSCEPQVNK